jgi:glyoxylase-like metal-dependent hydrolase (beta-lactamase superfamily II)
MRAILSGISAWSRFSEPHGYDFNGLLVLHPSGNIAIDPVDYDVDVAAELARAGITRILLTNRNHARAADRLHRETGAEVCIHPLDADHARRQGVGIDETFELGEQIGPFRVIGVPGKSPGEVALFDSARRLLIVGDALIGHPEGQLSLLPDRVVDDPKQLRASVRDLLQLDFDLLLLGDGRSLLANARAALEALVARFPD